MLQYPVTKHFCFTICTMKYCLLSEWVTRTTPHFIKEILNFGTAMIFQVFHLFTHLAAKNVAFFCSFWENIHLLHHWGKCWEAHCNPKVHCSTQFPASFFEQQTAWFVGFYFFGGQKEYHWTFPSIKTPNSLIKFLSASSKSSTLQDILLQKSTEMKKEGKKSFT